MGNVFVVFLWTGGVVSLLKVHVTLHAVSVVKSLKAKFAQLSSHPSQRFHSTTVMR